MPSDPWNVAQSIATIATAAFAAPMIYFATKQLRVAAEAYRIAAEQSSMAAKSASASALGALAAASRELQWRVLQDKSLHTILVPNIPADGFTPEMKCEMIRGMLISHYAFVFEFYRLGLNTPNRVSARTANPTSPAAHV
jgi:hypothetical protein